MDLHIWLSFPWNWRFKKCNLLIIKIGMIRRPSVHTGEIFLCRPWLENIEYSKVNPCTLFDKSRAWNSPCRGLISMRNLVCLRG